MRCVIKIGAKLIILLFPFFVLCPIAVKYMPMRFLDYEYSSYLQNQEWANGKGHDTYARILIMGDSTAKASWLPEALSEDTYNFALAGASPIENYFYLKEYLGKNPAPEYLFYMQGIELFYSPIFFWSRNVYFHRLDEKYLDEFMNKLSKTKDDDFFHIDNFREECFLYKTYSPSKYLVAFFKGLFSDTRYQKNMMRYQEVIETKGQTQFGIAERCDDMSRDVERYEFKPTNIIDIYFRKIIRLCEKHNIQFVFEPAPLNMSSYRNMQENVLSDYKSYMTSLQSTYPKARISTELYGLDNRYFGDTMHLNQNGTIYFSSMMYQEYLDIFHHTRE